MVTAKSDSGAGLFQHPSVALATDGGSRAPAIELVPANYFAPLDLGTVFARPGLLEVDLGCGDGSFLVAMAEKFPERNYLGIERMFGRVRSACARASRREVGNVRVLRVETSYAVKYLLPPESTAVVHLLFPDPWPKRRHERRRIVTKDFIAAVYRLIAPGGFFRIATDQADYFAAIRELVADFALIEEPAERMEAFPLTTFERRFLADGAPLYRFMLRKTA